MAEINVPIVKGKSSLTVNTDNIPLEVYQEIVLQGLKVLLNRGTSKVTKSTYPDEAELRAKAMEVAQAQLELVMTGKVKLSGQKAKKASGAVLTEARRIAKALVKDAMKANGIKVSHVAAKDITEAANALLDTDQGKEIMVQAEANLAERAKTPIAIDVKALIKEDPKLVAAANEKKAKAKADAPLSATQAGKVKAKAKAQPTA